MGNEFDDEDGGDEGGDHVQPMDERSPVSGGAARRRFLISGTIMVAGQTLGAHSANDNGAGVPGAGDDT